MGGNSGFFLPKAHIFCGLFIFENFKIVCKKFLHFEFVAMDSKNLSRGCSHRYREAKPFWESRLFEKDGTPKKFDVVHIVNGYKGTSPTAVMEYRGILGIEEFNGKECFKLGLGKILEIKNYTL